MKMFACSEIEIDPFFELHKLISDNQKRKELRKTSEFKVKDFWQVGFQFYSSKCHSFFLNFQLLFIQGRAD